MEDGEISNNTATTTTTSPAYGGGVRVAASGTFTMNGGEISDNTAPSGGGVYASGGIFTKKSGTIYGDTDAITGNGSPSDNTSTSGSGHAVYTDDKKRNSTAGPTIKLYAKYESAWTYDGTGVEGIGENTTLNWEN
jgi:hypothetical protein